MIAAIPNIIGWLAISFAKVSWMMIIMYYYKLIRVMAGNRINLISHPFYVFNAL